ncbi:MAG TPA: HDOD domain-containing protein, partial [Myxococcales bacterium]|nr:HDOD domain-containing protein [Myxococcales bacterium]
MRVQRWSPNYGRGVVEIAADSTADQVREWLRYRFASPDYRPPVLPAVAIQVLALSRKPDADLRDVAKLLEQDPVLAGRVLRLMQTPFYAARTPIRTLAEAVLRLGMTQVRNVVLEVSLNLRVFKAEGWAEPMADLARHSSEVA